MATIDRGSGRGIFQSAGKALFPTTFSPGFYGAFDLWFADHLGLRYPLIFKPWQVKRIDAQLRSIREQLSACDIPSAVLVAPNKESIYGEFLVNVAAGVPPSRLDMLLGELDPVARDMIVDPRPIMREAKLAHVPVRLYNKPDTHWNDLGAYYAYLAVM